MILSMALRALASVLRGLATALLWVAWLATLILWASRWCEDRAREWNPRLWDRTGGRSPFEARD